jgi:hypothetical protein
VDAFWSITLYDEDYALMRLAESQQSSPQISICSSRMLAIKEDRCRHTRWSATTPQSACRMFRTRGTPRRGCIVGRWVGHGRMVGR